MNARSIIIRGSRAEAVAARNEYVLAGHNVGALDTLIAGAEYAFTVYS